MKTAKVLVLCTVCILAFGISLPSCKKKEEKTEYSYRAALDNSTAEGAFNRSYSQISKAANQAGNKSTNDTIIGCPVLYITGGWPKTVTLDFGTGCLCDDGVTRKGKIISTITAPYIDSTSVITSTFDNYYENVSSTEYQVQGTQIITNLGHNTAGHPHFSVVVQNAKVSSNGQEINWTSIRENEWIAGYDTWINPWDDEYYVTGSANGTDVNGAAFSVTITSPLLWKFCIDIFRWTVTSGKIDIINPGYPTITVDYGTNTCDLIVYIIINGVTYTVVLG